MLAVVGCEEKDFFGDRGCWDEGNLVSKATFDTPMPVDFLVPLPK